MIHVKELINIAGYMRGACTPVGMKKTYPVFFDESINLLDKVYLSAGARGLAMKISPNEIVNYVKGTICSLTK